MIVKRIGLEARAFLQREKIMSVALVLGALTSCSQLPKLSYINFPVLSLLFCLMLVVSGFKKLRVMSFLAGKILTKCRSYHTLGLAIISITFVASMLVTNDVALLTFVPLTLTIAQTLKLDLVRVIIWQTIAANLGSALTPMGNPQNLFLYEYYALSPLEFLKLMLPLALLALAWLLGLIIKRKNFPLEVTLPPVKVETGSKFYVFCGLFLLNLLTVFRVVDYRISLLATVILVALASPKLFYYVDYSLLLTFVGFFILVGNISQWELIKEMESIILASSVGVYVTGILLSQFISNVPAAMLLAGFTKEVEALLLGVNVGGLGTLIASMASVISYKLYINNNKDAHNQYLRLFTYYNGVGLVGLGVLVWFLR